MFAKRLLLIGMAVLLALMLVQLVQVNNGSPPRVYAASGSAYCSGDDLVLAWSGADPMGIAHDFSGTGPGLPLTGITPYVLSGSQLFSGPGTWTGVSMEVVGWPDSVYYGDITCPPVPPTAAPAATLAPSLTPEPTATPLPENILDDWDGNQDGRLDVNAADHYVVYCANDLLDVYGAAGLVAQIPLLDLIAMGGISSSQQAGLDITRSGDAITVAGSTGYYAPEYGAKTFSLQSCLLVNDGPLLGQPCKYCR